MQWKTFDLKNYADVTVKSRLSNFDGEIGTANLADGGNLEIAYYRRGRMHCCVSLEENGLVSGSNAHLFLGCAFEKKSLPGDGQGLASS